MKMTREEENQYWKDNPVVFTKQKCGSCKQNHLQIQSSGKCNCGNYKCGFAGLLVATSPDYSPIHKHLLSNKKIMEKIKNEYIHERAKALSTTPPNKQTQEND